MCSADGDGTPSRRVAPFGDPRIKACVRLPEAYRSLPRPSSAQGTEASAVRPSVPWPPPRIPPRSGSRAPSARPRAAALGPAAGSPASRPSRLLFSCLSGHAPAQPASRALSARRSPLHLSRCNTGALGTSHRESAERFGPPCGGPSLRTVPVRVVGIGRLELPTSPLSGARSDHLSYMPAPEAARRFRRADGLATEGCEGSATVMERRSPIDLRASRRGSPDRRLAAPPGFPTAVPGSPRAVAP